MLLHGGQGSISLEYQIYTFAHLLDTKLEWMEKSNARKPHMRISELIRINQTRKPYSQGYLEYSQEYLRRIFRIGRSFLPLVFKSVRSAAIYPGYYFQIGPRSDR